MATPTTALTWMVVNDDVMGGVSSGQLSSVDEGLVHFEGEISLENNGGFASIRSKPAELDFHQATEVRVRVRGDGRTWNLNLYRSDVRLRAGSYRVPLPTQDGEVTETVVPLTNFRAASFGRPVEGAPPLHGHPERIDQVGFLLSAGRAGAFSLDVLSVEPLRTPELKAQSSTPDEMTWTHRLVVLVSPGPDVSELNVSRAALDREAAGMADRKIAVVTVVGDAVTGVNATADALATRWDLSRNLPFEALLVGLDGEVKARTHSPVDTAQWFARIDAMPMREAELRRRTLETDPSTSR